MNLREIREKNLKVQFKDLRQASKDLTVLDLNLRMGKSKDLKQKKNLKKLIARLKTVISEKGVLKNAKA